jgi:hypothetical protein
LSGAVVAGDERQRVADGGDRRREAHDPADAQQQQHAHDHRQREARHPCRVLPLGGKLIGEHGDEDDVVDAQDDLQDRQRDQGDQRLDREQVRDAFAAGIAVPNGGHRGEKRGNELPGEHGAVGGHGQKWLEHEWVLKRANVRRTFLVGAARLG